MAKAKKPIEPVEAVVVDSATRPEKTSGRTISTSAIFWGFAFIGFGALLLLDNLNILTVHFGNLWQLWPVLIIGAGVSMLSLRGWLAGFVSFILVISLGVLAYLVAVENPYYGTNTAVYSDQQITSVEASVDPKADKGLDVTLETGALRLDIVSSSAQTGLQAQLQSNHLSLKQDTVDIRDGTQYVRLLTESARSWWLGPINNQLRLELSETTPLAVHVDTGASSVNADFSHTKLHTLTLKAGASSIDLKFGDAVAKQEVTLEAGASRVALQVPQGLGVRLETENGLSGTNFESVDKVSDGVYESNGFATAEKQITIRAKIGVSSLRLSRY